jgi:lipopolysaccharide transport system ATP-binding protein
MSDHIAIRAESLGKKYIIGHQKSGDLREAFGQKIKKIFREKTLEQEEFWALEDLNFEIRKGEAVGIIGRNGAGKSTLLKLLSRITEPTTGRFTIYGRVSSLLEVGTGFHSELSGRENIFLNGTILGMRRAEVKSKFDEIVDFSGVEKFIDTPIKHYSSGMKVRLAFSVAAHLEPEILIVDEVLAVGDAEFQKKCLGKMNEVSKSEGRTVLFVSHNMSIIKGLCETGLLIDNGRLRNHGQISDVVDQYEKVNNALSDTPFLLRNDVVQRHPLKILDFQIYNVKEEKINACYSGQSVKIEIPYRYEGPAGENSEVAIAVQFIDSSERFVTVLNNKVRGFQIHKLFGQGKFVCKIDKMPLMSGRFHVNLLIQVNGKLSLKVDHIAFLDVIEADYFGSGFSNALGRQGVYVNNDWTHLNGET